MKSVILILTFIVAASAQSGGQFQIENAVVAPGGDSAGGRFALQKTIGQTLAGGNPQGGQFVVQNGFWTFGFAPTAAHVTLGGRVLTAGGQGIQNARLVLTAPDGTQQISLTGSFGSYRFSVPAGGTYLLTVFSKRFVFAEPTRLVNAAEDTGTFDFTAEPQ